MKTKPHEMKLRAGTPEFDRGVAFLMLVQLSDFCQPADKRLRSELAEKLSHGELRHGDVVLTV